MKFFWTQAVVLAICAVSISACSKPVAEHHHEHQEIVVTSPEDKSVTLTEQYVCQIHSRRHIDVRALEGGYLEQIPVAEGQVVKQGDSMFKIVATLYQARMDSATAEAQLAQVEYDNTKRLFEQNVVSDKEVMLAEAKLAKAKAEVQLAEARLNFTDVKAPFDGIIDRLHEQQGSLIEEGDILTTLSDNDVMWVYFNVPEARYLEYKTGLHQVVQTTAPAAQAEEDVDGGDPNELEIELILANGNKFGEHGEITAVEADFNNETGNIAFRADFPNPNALLRHGQTGTVLIHRELKDALVIPQRATFEILDKRYVYVIDKDNVARQREIVVDHEMEDIFVIKQGLKEEDKIVLEGVSQVRDGDKIDYEFRGPNLVFNNLKNVAE
jgi:membrane fusion protein, multidrug efflux system